MSTAKLPLPLIMTSAGPSLLFYSFPVLLLLLLPVGAVFSPTNKTCQGRRVYTLPLPPKFNTDLVYNGTRVVGVGRLGEKHIRFLNSQLQSLATNGGLGEEMGSHPGPGSLDGWWYDTNQNALEVIFHARMGTYECRTDSLAEADAVYVPFFGGHEALRQMHKELSLQDKLGLELVELMFSHPAWKRNNGSDFFMVLGRELWDFFRQGDTGWGSKLLRIDGIFANVWAVCVESLLSNKRVPSVPRPTAFHPQNRQQVEEWQDFVRSQHRPWLFSFAGGHRDLHTEEGVLREKLFWQCKGAKSCALVDCSALEEQGKSCTDINMFFDQYLRSTFCLHPLGDSCTRRSVIDAALAGCIPVVFKTCTWQDQYPWHFGEDKLRMFVYVVSKEVKGPERLLTTAAPNSQGHVVIEDVLKAIPEKEVKAMQQRIISAIPNVIYASGPNGTTSQWPDFEDAISITLNQLLAAIEQTKAKATQ